MKNFIYSLIVAAAVMVAPSPSAGNYLAGTQHLTAEGANFSWEQAESKSLRILVEYKNALGEWKATELGSGFLISGDGYFVTAYHVMKYCLQNKKAAAGFGEPVPCSAQHPKIRYKALNDDQLFDIDIISHLREQDSVDNKATQSPDETMKQRDFVIGRLRTAKMNFSHWPIRHFSEGLIDLARPSAEFEFEPLYPPKKVFVIGYPGNREFAITAGYLNLKASNLRGYFAADIEVYSPGYLRDVGISPDTKWGIRVENHMSGGAVVDADGFVVGLVVNGHANTTGVLSIENVLENFTSRSNRVGDQRAVILVPTKIPLYLKKQSYDY
jgi:S1-C subfamily serine protease